MKDFIAVPKKKYNLCKKYTHYYRNELLLMYL